MLFVFQWDEYYCKLALKHRRGSNVQRVPMKRPSSTHLNGLENHALYPSLRFKSGSDQDGQQTQINSLNVQLPNEKVTSVTRKDSRRGADNDIEIAKSRTMSNPMRADGTGRKTTLSSEKNSTSCTIS